VRGAGHYIQLGVEGRVTLTGVGSWVSLISHPGRGVAGSPPAGSAQLPASPLGRNGAAAPDPRQVVQAVRKQWRAGPGVGGSRGRRGPGLSYNGGSGSGSRSRGRCLPGAAPAARRKPSFQTRPSDHTHNTRSQERPIDHRKPPTPAASKDTVF